eukprot:2139782-Ditylum_brightwellii.AAC.2
MGTVSHFLDIKFQWEADEQGEVTCHLSQGAFIDNLTQLAQLEQLIGSTPPTPYHNGLPVDAIKNKPPDNIVEHQTLMTTHCSIVSSLNWLAISTHPDISTITNLLAQHQNKTQTGVPRTSPLHPTNTNNAKQNSRILSYAPYKDISFDIMDLSTALHNNNGLQLEAQQNQESMPPTNA